MSRMVAMDRWFATHGGRPDAGLTLFCLPHAGGSASAFRGWTDDLPHTIDVRPVQLPGREARIAESPRIDLTELADAIGGRISGPYAIFGHSMGGRLGFEVVRELRRRGLPPPVRLIVGGSLPPDRRTALDSIARLPDDQFCDRVIALGGMSPEVLAEPELRDLLLPTLRSDFAMLDAYRYLPDEPLKVPILAVAGVDDTDANPAGMVGWSAHTRAGFDLRTLPGGHFFPQTHRSALLALIGTELTKPAAPGLADDEVLVVEARLDDLPDLCAAYDELAPSEWDRVAAFRRPADATRFAGRAVLLRRLLAQYGVDVATSEFTKGANGKPSVPELHFNASHSDGIALIALRRSEPVGIDVERLRPIPDVDGIAGIALDPAERAELAAVPDDERDRAVLATWTAKEALLKATGDGLSVEPSRFGFAGQSGRRHWAASVTAGLDRLSRYRITHFDPPGAIAALATGTGSVRLRYRCARPGDDLTDRERG